MPEKFISGDSSAIFSFFLKYVAREVRSMEITDDEVLYTAKVLADFAQTSRYSSSEMPLFCFLTEVMDNFMADGILSNDPEMMEFAGSSSLLLAGFFRDQMRRRHNLHWFDELGTIFYSRAGHFSRGKKREVMYRMSEHFPVWSRACCKVSRRLRENRFILGQ